MSNFEKFQEMWTLGYITETTLRTWVRINKSNPALGITAEEFEQITGIAY